MPDDDKSTIENPQSPDAKTEPDEAPATETSTEAAPAAPAKPEPKVVPQDEVDRIVEKRLAKERRKHERELAELKAKPNSEQTTTTAKPTDTDTAAKLAALEERLNKSEQDRIFAEQLGALKIDTNATQRKMLRAEFDPDDPDAIKQAAKDAGWLTDTTKAPAQVKSEPNPSEGVMSQYKSPGAPSTPPRGDITLDPISWTQDDIARMKADDTFLANIEKWADTLPGGGGGLFRKKIPKG